MSKQPELTKVRELLTDMLKDDDMPAHWFAQRINEVLDNPIIWNVDESCGQDAEAEKCKDCDGTGKHGGYPQTLSECQVCDGSGQEIPPCSS